MILSKKISINLKQFICMYVIIHVVLNGQSMEIKKQIYISPEVEVIPVDLAVCQRFHSPTPSGSEDLFGIESDGFNKSLQMQSRQPSRIAPESFADKSISGGSVF